MNIIFFYPGDYTFGDMSGPVKQFYRLTFFASQDMDEMMSLGRGKFYQARL